MSRSCYAALTGCTKYGATYTCKGACRVGKGTLAASESATVTIVVKPTVGGTLNNSATVTSTEIDVNLANNTAAAP